MVTTKQQTKTNKQINKQKIKSKIQSIPLEKNHLTTKENRKKKGTTEQPKSNKQNGHGETLSS